MEEFCSRSMINGTAVYDVLSPSFLQAGIHTFPLTQTSKIFPH